MLRHRLATAAVAIPLLLLLIYKAPPWGFGLLLAVIAVLGAVEYCGMAFPERLNERVLFTGMAVLIAVAIAVQGAGGPAGTGPLRASIVGAAITAMIIGSLLWVLIGRSDFENGLADLGRGILGVLYTAFLLPHFVLLHSLPHGPDWVVFVVLIAMLGDSGGYFTGRTFGRHKLSPRISPSKTVEGAVGSVLAAMLGGVATKLILLPFLSWTEVLLLAFGQVILGQLGDLCESIMKRTYGAKDSGRLFPGHGGVLDRIDSLVFPVAAMYYYVSWFS